MLREVLLNNDVPPTKTANLSLAKRSVAAFLWGTGGGIVRIFMQLGAQIALARILGPSDYGLFAIGVMVVGVSSYFADFGLAYGLIQKQLVTDDDVRFVWTWQCLLGLSIAVSIWACSSFLATLFKKPELEQVFAWLTWVLLFNALSAPSTNLLKKALDYRALQLGMLTSYFIGFVCIGIPLALGGFGVYALVGAMLSQVMLNLAILYWFCRHPIGLRFFTPGGRSMLGYGAVVLGTNLINWLLTTADKILVGKVFTAHIVGLYTNAFNLVNSPAAAAYGNLQSVMFSACARLQGDVTALKTVFLRLLAAVCLFAFPFFTLLAVGAEYAIAGIYGAQWASAAPYLRIFSCSMPFLLLWGISTPILWNTGKPSLELRIQVPLAAGWCAVMFAVSSSPGYVIALSAAALMATRACIMALLAVRLLQVSASEILRAVRGGALLTLLMVVAGLMWSELVAELPRSAVLQLGAFLTMGLFGYVAMLIVLGPLLIDRRLAESMSSLSRNLPRPITRILEITLRGKLAP